MKKISFDRIVRVVLIPTINEYNYYNLINDIWYSKIELYNILNKLNKEIKIERQIKKNLKINIIQ